MNEVTKKYVDYIITLKKWLFTLGVKILTKTRRKGGLMITWFQLAKLGLKNLSGGKRFLGI